MYLQFHRRGCRRRRVRRRAPNSPQPFKLQAARSRLLSACSKVNKTRICRTMNERPERLPNEPLRCCDKRAARARERHAAQRRRHNSVGPILRRNLLVVVVASTTTTTTTWRSTYVSAVLCPDHLLDVFEIVFHQVVAGELDGFRDERVVCAAAFSCDESDLSDDDAINGCVSVGRRTGRIVLA